MTVVIEVVAAVVVVALLAAAALRWRKIRRDEHRLSSVGTLIGPPPSPYQAAKGFRLLDGDSPIPHPEPAPLHLESSHEYVFGDATVSDDEVSISPQRHDVQWALDRSAHRSPLARRRQVVAFLVVIVVVIVGLFVVVRHPWSSARTNTGAPVVVRATVVDLHGWGGRLVAEAPSKDPTVTWSPTVNAVYRAATSSFTPRPR